MNVWDLIVKIAGDGQSLRDDIDQDKAKVDELDQKLAGVRDKDVSLKVSTQSAKDHIDQLKKDMDELRHKSLQIFVRDQEAEDKLYTFNAHLQELQDKILNLNVNDRDAKDKLDTIRLESEDLKNELEHMLVGLEDTEAIAKIDDLILRLDTIHDQTVTITARLDDTEAKPKFDALLLKEQELRRVLMQVDFEDADVVLKVKELQLELDRIHKTVLTVDLRDEDAILKLDELDLKLDGVKRRIDGINATSVGTKGKFSLGTLLGSLFPVASPLAADAGGGMLGLLSAAAPGMAGGAGYAAVAGSTLMPVFTAEASLKTAQAQYQATLRNPAATNAQKLQALQAVHQSTANLDGGQMQALGQVQQFGTFMKGFDQSFQPQVLQSFTSVLQLLQNVLKDLAPAIHGFASGLNELLSGANKALGSPVWKSFFSYLGSNAKASILAFGTGLGNIATGFASLLMAFNPLARSMDAGWTKMTASFANWAANVVKTKGFQQFLDYVKQTGPQVLSLIGNLGSIVVKLFEAMAPAGQNLLTMVTGLASLANTLLKVNPLIGQIVVGVIQMVAFKSVLGWVSGVGGGFTKLGKTLTSTTGFVAKLVKVFPGLEGAMKLVGSGAGFLGKAFTLLGGPWGLLIAAIIAGALLIIGHWKQISSEAKTLWHDVSGFFSKLGQDIEHIWGGVLKWLDGLWLKISAFFKKWGPDILIALAPFIGIPLTIYQRWGQITAWFTKLWDSVVGGVKTFASNILNNMDQIGNNISNYFAKLGQEALTWGENVVHMVANGIMSGIHWVTNAVSSVANSISSLFGVHSSQTLAVSPSVSAMVTGSGSTASASHSTLTVTHQGSVTVGGLTPRAVQQVNQQLNTQLLRKMR
ncbi:hypothetical protein [Alicyclobacillus ferrooxydans]|uniref:Uncharacterized protein n=1 Tax=Alicyclobacillus ferrooxydans TaxID=471514 RepID=A0A0P9GNH6_9BACL|nr:hypothetical protein [Alicyclobacillus ferrooxydans]KPV42024.1 hypothetical protein AN477_19845 [Alicyclobacillus ferrooxydans]